MSRVEIDLNSRNAEGLTLARIARVHGARPAKGQLVTVFESEDEVRGLAMVAEVDDANGYLYLMVNWDSMRHDDGSELGVGSDSNIVNRAQATAANARAVHSVDRRTNAARMPSSRASSFSR